jgi:hypothetical protein
MTMVPVTSPFADVLNSIKDVEDKKRTFSSVLSEKEVGAKEGLVLKHEMTLELFQHKMIEKEFEPRRQNTMVKYWPSSQSLINCRK